MTSILVEMPDYNNIVHGFWREIENFDFREKGYHAKEYLKGSRMVQISVS